MRQLIGRFFGLEEEWQRPAPDRAGRWADVRLALGFLLLSVLLLELMRSMGALQDTTRFGAPGQYLTLSSAALLLVWRRAFPALVAALASVHLLIASALEPMTMSLLAMQVLYFFAIYSGVAWARDRRVLVGAVGVILGSLLLWFAWFFALGSGLEEMRAGMVEEGGGGLFPALPAAVAFVAVNNVVFYVGAIILGQIAWNGARDTARVAEQAATIAQQGARLRDQAVVAERLRIARELHDVVAHHVSVMGVQAAAARRVMDRDPAAAGAALAAVEGASRDAVGQMRDLLGTLRSGEEASGGVDEAPDGGSAGSRAPQPTLSDLPTMVAQFDGAGCEVSLRVVQTPDGAAARVAPPVQLSAYRVVQEALANVRQHSTARHASVVVRVDERGAGRVEVEVVDDGQPRGERTAGGGLGQLGMRERAQHLGGGVETGRRHGGDGYRVRVWFPLEATPRASSGPDATPPGTTAPQSVDA